MKISCHLAPLSALLLMGAPLLADAPSIPAPAPSAQHALDKLVGKHEVIGLTERGGSRYLGHVISGDHGLYVFQTFHYAGAPQTSLQTTTVTGYRRRRSRETTRITTHTTVADDVAVQALLSGVTGPTYRPHQEAAGRELIAASDVICLQRLSPPPKPKVASASAAVASPGAVVPVSSKWTLKTLWTSLELPVPVAAKQPAK